MGYILKLFDTDLLKFDVIENLADPVLKITWIDESRKALLPLGMEVSDDGIASFIRHRCIPKNRAYVNAFLAKNGLSANRPMDVITVCKGLSLNDSYWITEEDSVQSFASSNLYENRFSRLLAWTAFTGYGSSVRATFLSSPEFTTNGMLPKCWRRMENKIYLYKGATSGAANTGMEPYSELYAYEIGAHAGFSVIPYKISVWKGNVCSVCELFTSKDLAYVPVGYIIKKGGMDAVRKFYGTLGAEFVDALDEMLVFDAIVCNTDRHFGNFGVLVDSHTNQIAAPAPLFDHGNALFNLAGEENWENENVLQAYIDTLFPCAYDDFMEEAKRVLKPSIREKVKKLLTFEVKKMGRTNYDRKKLKLMTKMIQKRARALLES